MGSYINIIIGNYNTRQTFYFELKISKKLMQNLFKINNCIK